jgi:hypothetical protein
MWVKEKVKCWEVKRRQGWYAKESCLEVFFLLRSIGILILSLRGVRTGEIFVTNLEGHFRANI